MNQSKYEDLLEARKILALRDTASLSTIKEAYHKKIKEILPLI